MLLDFASHEVLWNGYQTLSSSLGGSWCGDCSPQRMSDVIGLMCSCYCKEQLKRYFEMHNWDQSNFGQGTNRSLREFAEELVTGQNPLHRPCHRVTTLSASQKGPAEKRHVKRKGKNHQKASRQSFTAARLQNEIAPEKVNRCEKWLKNAQKDPKNDSRRVLEVFHRPKFAHKSFCSPRGSAGVATLTIPWTGKSCSSNRALVKTIFEALECL